MPTKVSVNSGQIAINDGSTFLVTASDGSINDNLAQGFFVEDTRLISQKAADLYQRFGSVWPHDNSSIAAGLKSYGYDQQANRIAEGIFAAASYFEAGRMPELFGGIERNSDSFPVPYPDANIPQAWAAGSIFLLIRTILGLKANAPGRRLLVQPSLPEWLPDLELTNLGVADANVGLRFWREDEKTRWEVTHLDGNLQVEADE